MASIEEIKAGLAGAGSDANTTSAQARAGADAADRMIARLTAVARGTNHPKLAEAIAKAQQSKQRFAEAAALADAAAKAAREYIGILG